MFNHHKISHEHFVKKKINVIKAVTAVTELNTTTTTLVFLGKIDANLSWISIIVSIPLVNQPGP